jgi:23S rRNA (adenine2503-C2)-methyltransferase
MMPHVALKTLSVTQLDEFLAAQGWPRYRSRQVLDWIYRRGVTRFDDMTNLGRSERTRLADIAVITEPVVSEVQHDAEDGTEKLLFRLEDGETVESVLIPDEDRLTLCLSTQVGCTLDCAFCLTGTMGLKRNLKAHEIVDQVLGARAHAGPERPITNLVFMGMGEPLANLAAVCEAIERLTAPWGLGYSPRRITVSTSGLVPQMAQLGAFRHPVNLAVSLNATTDDVRDRVMGTINRKYPLAALLGACRAYPLSPRRRIFFEYVLLSGVNDTPADARRLVKLLHGIRCKINLIPFNPWPGARFERPADAAVAAFQSILLDAHFSAFVRKSKGRQILAACGQLRSAHQGSPLLPLDLSRSSAVDKAASEVIQPTPR